MGHDRFGVEFVPRHMTPEMNVQPYEGAPPCQAPECEDVSFHSEHPGRAKGGWSTLSLHKVDNFTFKILQAGGFEVAVWEQTAQEGHMEHRLLANKIR